ncbi:hypothetical protein L7F22_053541 [Adiantum nelumboides]|nr:hypothetical protein [Adiantum nelumboides]
MEFGDYVNVIKLLAKQFSPSEVLTEVLSVFAKWSHDLESSRMPFSTFCKLKEAFHSKESPIIPTTQNKWASLHSSARLVCWCDDEAIGRQFLTSDKVLYVCVSTTSGKGLIEADNIPQIRQLLPFFKALDIFPLSKVVEREYTICAATWSKKMFDMLNWSFPYTQRYLQRWHKEIYKHLQQTSFDVRLKRVQCFHAERLSFRYKLPMKLGLGMIQVDADYLLQGEMFYGTSTENLKSLFIEFSRIYFDGTPNLQLASFLCWITSAFQVGSSVAELEDLLATQEHQAKEKDLTQIQDQFSWDRARKQVDGQGVAGNATVCNRSLAAVINAGGIEELGLKAKKIRSCSTPKDAPALIEAHAVEAHADGTDAKLWEKDPCKNHKVQGLGAITELPIYSSLAGLTLPSDADHSSEDKILFGNSCEEQALLTGRLGEAVVFNHLMEKYGTNHVNWINAETERGLPYDIVVEEFDGLQVHIVVKSTCSANKDWFEISSQEWEFAVQAGEKFMITRVFFSQLSGSARFVWLRNPVKLCQDKRVRLALIAPS